MQHVRTLEMGNDRQEGRRTPERELVGEMVLNLAMKIRTTQSFHN